MKNFKKKDLEKEVLVINKPAPRKKKKDLLTYKNEKRTKVKPNTYTKKKKDHTHDYGSFSNIDIKKLHKGHIINLEKVYFDADTSSVDQKSIKVLDDLYHFLQDNKNLVIEVGGHTNSTPSVAYCNKLSTERAKVVADYLINRGIDPKRITYKGYGKSHPIATNKSLAGRRRNQRVEIKIIKVK